MWCLYLVTLHLWEQKDDDIPRVLRHLDGLAGTPTRTLARWTPGKPRTEDYYYDKNLPTQTLRKEYLVDKRLYPPSNMDLSDAWVIKVMASNLTGKERGIRWPAVFDSKGYPRRYYINKGRAAKMYDPDTKLFYYQGAFNLYQFFGSEGAAQDYVREFNTGQSLASRYIAVRGDLCYAQNDDYNPSNPAGTQKTARSRLKPDRSARPLIQFIAATSQREETQAAQSQPITQPKSFGRALARRSMEKQLGHV